MEAGSSTMVEFFENDLNVWLEPEDFSNMLLLEQNDLSNLYCEPLFLDVVESTAEEVPNDAHEFNEAELEKGEASAKIEIFLPRDMKTNQFKCPQCPKVFQFKSRLVRHLSTHQVQFKIISRYVA